MPAPEDLVEYLFRLLLIASGLMTVFLLLSAVARLLDWDGGGAWLPN